MATDEAINQVIKRIISEAEIDRKQMRCLLQRGLAEIGVNILGPSITVNGPHRKVSFIIKSGKTWRGGIHTYSLRVENFNRR